MGESDCSLIIIIISSTQSHDIMEISEVSWPGEFVGSMTFSVSLSLHCPQTAPGLAHYCSFLVAHSFSTSCLVDRHPLKERLDCSRVLTTFHLHFALENFGLLISPPSFHLHFTYRGLWISHIPHILLRFWTENFWTAPKFPVLSLCFTLQVWRFWIGELSDCSKVPPSSHCRFSTSFWIAPELLCTFYLVLCCCAFQKSLAQNKPVPHLLPGWVSLICCSFLSILWCWIPTFSPLSIAFIAGSYYFGCEVMLPDLWTW